MKILAIHANNLEFEAKKQAVSSAEKISEAKQSLDECLVVFLCAEKPDESNPEDVLLQLKDHVVDISGKVNTKKIVLYPYAHLSSDLASPDVAKKMLLDAHALLEKDFEVIHAPFGWYKAFTISCKGHPLSELSKQFFPRSNVASCCEGEALEAERKLKSHWFILDVSGKLNAFSDFDFSGHENLKKFASYESDKDRSAPKEPHHVRVMRQHELVDYEAASDSGNLRYYPKGRLMKKLLETFVTDKVVEYGGLEVETPIMYNVLHPSLARYLAKFPARQYRIESDKNNYFLRFAACFGQFLIAHDSTFSYKQLPLRLYEMTRYSFRHEQRGELTGLKRLRAFTMPDVHALCGDIDQTLEEYERRFDLSLDTLESIGFSRDEFEMALRVTREFYDEHKEFVNLLVKKLGKPILLEMWDERKFYFVLKYEFNFVDSNNKASALSTDQIDIENGKSYNMFFTDKDGQKKIVPYVLHCSPSGAIERVLYGLFERTYFQEKKGVAPSFPLWLSPTQVRLVPLNKEKHLSACVDLANSFKSLRIRADVDDTDESVSKRVRNAEKEWVPYILVVGDRELESQKYNVRVRGVKEQKEFSVESLVKEISENTKGLPWAPLPLPSLLSARPIFVG